MTAAPGLMVREAVEGDLPAITRLYNHFVTETIVNFDVRPFTVEERRVWFGQFSSSGRWRIFVAEYGGRFAGFVGSMKHKAKLAYETSVETTIYVDPDYAGRGIGRALYDRLFQALAGEDVHRALAGVALPNDASLALHRALGFTEIGVFHEVGRKFGRYHDVLWLEKGF